MLPLLFILSISVSSSLLSSSPSTGTSVGTSVALADALSPLGAGVAQAGRAMDVVLRPTAESCRLLLSDAKTDEPILGARLVLHVFGAATSKPHDLTAVPGNEDGHYLSACPEAGSALAIDVTGGSPSGSPNGSQADLFAFQMPPVPSPPPADTPAPHRPFPIVAVVAILGIAALTLRRFARVLIAAALFLGASLGAGDARAHGADEAAIPVAPGTEIHVAQEIQFALGLRTTPVAVGEFVPAGREAPGAARQYPAVPRSAVVERDGKKIVFVRLRPELFVGREAILGWSNGDQVAVISGINPGDLAVSQGGAFLRNGGASAP